MGVQIVYKNKKMSFFLEKHLAEGCKLYLKKQTMHFDI